VVVVVVVVVYYGDEMLFFIADISELYLIFFFPFIDPKLKKQYCIMNHICLYTKWKFYCDSRKSVGVIHMTFDFYS